MYQYHPLVDPKLSIASTPSDTRRAAARRAGLEVCVLLFMALNRKNHGHISECWDVPFSIDYIEARFESLHMTVIDPWTTRAKTTSTLYVTVSAVTVSGPTSPNG